MSQTPHNLGSLLELPDALFEPVGGGFTPAEKFVVRTPDDIFFIKAIERDQHPFEATVLDHEAKIYQLLRKVGLAGDIFPAYRDYHTRGNLSVLTIDYLPGLAWGGPWTMHNIKLIDRTLNKLHTTQTSPKLKAEIMDVADALDKALENHATNVNTQKQQSSFNEAWAPSQASFVNILGETIFTAHSNKNLADAINKQARRPHTDRRLSLQDVNFGNIGFGKNQAYLVDPPYLRLGHPDSDRTVLGINILRQAPAESIAQAARRRFITNLPVLAEHTMYWVACTRLSPEISRSEWGIFQQSCALTALGEFQRLHLLS